MPAAGDGGAGRKAEPNVNAAQARDYVANRMKSGN